MSFSVFAPTDCPSYTNNQTACQSYGDCNWKSDNWGTWCENKGCWNFFTQANCQNSTAIINQSCQWRTGASGWCEQVDCWGFSGTNESACESNDRGLQCTWNEQCMSMGGGAGSNCWSITNNDTCAATAGCQWGDCFRQGCMGWTNQSACTVNLGFNGRTCRWNSRDNYCYEGGCFNYNNQSDCQTNNCTWNSGFCSDPSCSDWSYTNNATCEGNAAGIKCTWDNSMKRCDMRGCWFFNNEQSCEAVNLSNTQCQWHTDTSGWCEKVECFSWDSMSGGNQSTCVNNSAGLNCAWQGMPEGNNTNGWCFQNITTSLNCNSITNDKACMDTMYCWWNFGSSTCDAPASGGGGGPGGIAIFTEWNPGCYVFDSDQSVCNRIFGCNYSNSKCIANETFLQNNTLSCDRIRNSTICNSISVLGSCCKWQGGICDKDWSSNACREQMQAPPEGAGFCQDYNAFDSETLCSQIAGFPWYMPCEWDNVTKHCRFKANDVFGTPGQGGGFASINNEQNCEAAGGKWIVDTYCARSNGSWVAVPDGKCEHKFNEERNCNKYCYACEFKNDGSAWASQSEAKTACENSKAGLPSDAPTNAVGWCEFDSYSSQNSEGKWGECRQREDFKKMGGKSCDSDCGACTFMGKVSEGQPQEACKNSAANCKWFVDPKDTDNGWCGSANEKSCADKCDRCYEELSCKNTGQGGGGNCTWESSAGICQPSSGAGNMEICWDGTDNNNNQKTDCADSMCLTDPFCGGGTMFNDFGKDCFGFTTNATCVTEGCVWVNESWGAWCDMPMAVCWKFDGTGEQQCENNTVAGENVCEWHTGGGGGFCKINESVASQCAGRTNETCETTTNCKWIIDDYCQEKGGWCEGRPSHTGAFVECWKLDMDDCTGQSAACQWQVDPWCQQQGANSGFCDFVAFGCWQYTSNATCTGGQAGNYCRWLFDDMMSQWRCDAKCFDPNLNQNACINTALTNQSNCTWSSGFCDPKGFGGEMGPGGGSGMQCFRYDGNRTGCENTTGCSYFSETVPFCDINFASDCKQYTYDENTCNLQPGCKWNPNMNGCDERPFECMWNSTLQTNSSNCLANSNCMWSDNFCSPKCFNSSITSAQCAAAGSCRWVDGWCDPGMGAGMFENMEKGAPVMLGMDPCGQGSPDAAIPEYSDICGFGMKDMKDGWGFGIGVYDFSTAAICNDVKMMGGTGSGRNQTKFYWFLDTDGNTSNNCYSLDGTLRGFEFYFKYDASYDTDSGGASETYSANKCSSGNWTIADIKLTSKKQFMCTEIQGGMIVVQKADLNKFPSLFTAGADMRVYVETAGNSTNGTVPLDTCGPGYASPNAIDFKPECCWEPGADCDEDNVTSDSDPDCEEILRKGFVEYEDCLHAGDEDNDGLSDCNDPSCRCENSGCTDMPNCAGLGVNAPGYIDSTAPEIVSIRTENYNDSVLIMYDTNEPANGTLIFYQTSSTCSDSVVGRTEVYDIGINDSNVRKYRVSHDAELYWDGLSVGNSTSSLAAPLIQNGTYYYKIKICDTKGNCATSGCMSFKTAESYSGCHYCDFVSRIGAPTGWNISYDVDQDGVFEHQQGQVCGRNAGMRTNYSDGRRVNINITKADGTTWIAFLNARLTVSGLNRQIRDVQTSGLTSGTNGTYKYAGLPRETRDKIVNNLRPRRCLVMIPGTSNELWHCSDNLATCVEIENAVNLYLNESSDAGSGYRVWDVPYCEFSVWSSGDITYTPPGGSTPPGGGGGTTGGGGGGKTTQTVALGSVVVGTSYKAAFTQVTKLHVFEVTLNPSSSFTSLNLTIEERTVRPSETDNITDPVYGYFDVSTKLSSNTTNATKLADSDVTEAAIKFRVKRSWIENNTSDKANVVLLRNVNTSWNTLTTTYVGESADGSANASTLYYYYSAKTPGFSSFAITAGKAANATAACTAGQKRCTGSNLETCKADGSGWDSQACENGCDSTTLACKAKETPAEKICTPDAKRCTDTKLEKCKADGSAWEASEVCAYGCDSAKLECKAAPAGGEGTEAGNIWPYVIAVIVIIVLIAAFFLYARKKNV